MEIEWIIVYTIETGEVNYAEGCWFGCAKGE